MIPSNLTIRLIRKYRLVAVLFICSLLKAEAGYCYEMDTHYYLTYGLARLVGYTPTQSWQIASADWSVDINETTEPLQLGQGEAGNEIRTRFHAFPGYLADNPIPGLELKLSPESYRVAVEEGRQKMWNFCLSHGNIGIYIHYLQDTYAHGGFFSKWGHGTFTGPGHAADFVSHDMKRANEMAFATVDALKAYMLQKFPDQKPCDVNPAKIEAMVQAVLDANPDAGIDLPALAFFSAAGTYVGNWILDKLPGNAGGFQEGPVADKVVHPLEALLHEVIGLRQNRVYNYDRWGYCLDANYRVETANPMEEIIGNWILPFGKHNSPNSCAINDSLDFVRMDIKHDDCQSGKRAIEFSGSKCWDNGKYDAATREWTFSRIPDTVEMDRRIPSWAKAKVAGTLVWHIILKVNYSDCKFLDESLYQGDVHWEKKDSNGVHTQDAYVIPQNEKTRAGWGTAKNFSFFWWGGGMRNCNPKDLNRRNEPPPKCGRCGDLFCIDHKIVKGLKEAHKREMKVNNPGYPQELLDLVDRLPDCEAAIEWAPVAIHIYIISNSGQVESVSWTKHDEDICKNDLTATRIKAYYFVLAAEAFSCCGETKYNQRADWDAKYGFNKDLAIAHTRR